MSDSARRGGRSAAAEPIVTVSVPAAGVVLVTVRGFFGAAAVGACRRVTDDILALEPSDVVLDLSRARCDATTVSVLALMRRYAARHGVRIALTPTSRAAWALLRRAGQGELYRTVRPDTPTVALGNAVGGS